MKGFFLQAQSAVENKHILLWGDLRSEDFCSGAWLQHKLCLGIAYNISSLWRSGDFLK
jgi:hypothetical protein